ncbi:MAG: DUF1080 domain-containing protein, partial [Planctomycetes bacterium]|nr:DUF1080 domain-containing protein [Planctomycetota bacterium]
QGLGKWEHHNGSAASWKVLADGVIECYPRKFGNKKGGTIRTKKKYRNFEMHLEFKVPYLPAQTDQGRGNSGLFFQDKYEVQILDSFGSLAGWTDCGSLYRVAPPKVNMCAPPEQWQTYDIIFKAATFDKSGKVLSYPEANVIQNGVLIHKAQELREVTAYTESGRKSPPVKEPGAFQLQDHGHKVQFRNFWVKEL